MEYLENQFRRFTFLLEKDSESSILKNDLDTLCADGILNVERYNKENQYFIIIDALPKMNYANVKEVFSKFQSQPLERIYELDQANIYVAEEGQLKTSLKKFKRFVWTLLLEEDPELIAEYKRVHSIGQAWPEITQNMKQVGVIDMEIYLHKTQAILIMDTQPDFDLEKVGPIWQDLPRESEWQEYVAKFQKVDPLSNATEKWETMLAQ